MITLTYQTTTITLHEDMLWQDEFAWNPVEQKTERTLTGALIVEYGTKLAGRPITLQSEENTGWLPLTTINTLKTWSAVAGREMVLNIRGVTFNVIFRHSDGAVDASPVVRFNSPDAADFYTATIRLMEI